MAYLDHVTAPNNKQDFDIFGGGDHVTNRQGYVRKAQPQQQYKVPIAKNAVGVFKGGTTGDPIMQMSEGGEPHQGFDLEYATNDDFSMPISSN